MPEAEPSLWQAILRDVASQTATGKTLPPKNIVIFGDERAGKSTLLHRLQGKKHAGDESLKGTGLEFSYVDIKEEDAEDFKTLLEYIINPSTLSSTVVVVVLDMSKPWTLARSLERWLHLLSEHLSTLNSPELDDLKAKLVTQFLAYTEAPLAAANKTGAETQEAAAPEPAPAEAKQLEDGMLTHNLGVPVIVVCTKCDATASLEKDRDYRQEHFDFIQMHLRKLCLAYGAALIYNGKDGRTTPLLRRYLAHRAWGLPLQARSNIAERDAVFVPSGWDSLKKIDLLHDSFKTFRAEDSLDTRIVPPPSQQAHVAEAEDVEEEQEFLKRAQQLLGTPGRENDPIRAPSISASSRANASLSNIKSEKVEKQASVKESPTPVKTEATPQKSNPNNQLLSKFFSSLLKSES